VECLGDDTKSGCLGDVFATKTNLTAKQV